MKLFGREFLLQLKSSLQCGRRLCEKRPHQHFHMRDSTRRARFGALVVISLHEPDSLKAWHWTWHILKKQFVWTKHSAGELVDEFNSLLY